MGGVNFFMTWNGCCMEEPKVREGSHFRDVEIFCCGVEEPKVCEGLQFRDV